MAETCRARGATLDSRARRCADRVTGSTDGRTHRQPAVGGASTCEGCALALAGGIRSTMPPSRCACSKTLNGARVSRFAGDAIATGLSDGCMAGAARAPDVAAARTCCSTPRTTRPARARWRPTSARPAGPAGRDAGLRRDARQGRRGHARRRSLPLCDRVDLHDGGVAAGAMPAAELADVARRAVAGPAQRSTSIAGAGQRRYARPAGRAARSWSPARSFWSAPCVVFFADFRHTRTSARASCAPTIRCSGPSSSSRSRSSSCCRRRVLGVGAGRRRHLATARTRTSRT